MRAGLLVLVVTLSLGAPALHAYSNDVDMSGLAKWEGDCDPYGKAPCEPVREPGSARVVPDQDAFDGLVQEMGVLLAPRDMGPAGTTGQSGFDIAMEVSGHKINNQNTYWGRSLERRARKTQRDYVYPAMGTAQLWLKKGLPYSLQVGAGGTYLMESRIFAAGVQGRWAVLEGFFWLPDLALHAGASKSLCMDLPTAPASSPKERETGLTLNSCGSDLDLAMVTSGLAISKTFAFLGMLTVSPYAGWEKVFVHALSPQVDRDETTNDRSGETFHFRDYKIWGDLVGQKCGESGEGVEECFLDSSGSVPLPQAVNLLTHRNKLYAGLNLHFWILQAAVQGEVTHVRGTRVVLDNPALNSSNTGLTGVTLPDLQWTGTVRVGLLF